jgi:hypothetical protein
VGHTLEPLLHAHPEWRAAVRSDAADDGSAYDVLELQAPPGAHVEHGLFVSTENEEITVGFDVYHSHFDSWVDEANPGYGLGALEFINNLLAEKVAVLSWWTGETWAGSSQLAAGESPKLPSWAGAPKVDRVRVRSWNGSLNADIEV